MQYISDKASYFLVLLVVLLSGVPFFSGNDTYLALSFLLALAIYFKNIGRFTPYFMTYNYVIVFLLILQALAYQYFSAVSSIGLLIRFAFPFFVVMLVGKRFIPIFVNIIYAFTLISFVLYLLSLVFPEFKYYMMYQIAPYFEVERAVDLYRVAPNIIVYTMNHRPFDPFLRNSGPFWEPGGFATFLIVALMLNIVQTRKLRDKRSIVFSIAVLTTFSTTGYIALMFTYIFYFRYISKKMLLTPFIVLSFLLISTFAITQLDFIANKIENRWVTTISSLNNLEKTRRNRFISAAVDLEDIKAHPLIGLGRTEKTRYQRDIDYIYRHRNNGVTDFTVKFGLIFTFLYFFTLFKSFKGICRNFQINEKFARSMLFIIFLLGLSQILFLSSVFISLVFLNRIYPDKKKMVKAKKYEKSIYNYSHT